MKKKGKTVCQIIRFRGKIEAFLVSIDEFAISSKEEINVQNCVTLPRMSRYIHCFVYQRCHVSYICRKCNM